TVDGSGVALDDAINDLIAGWPIDLKYDAGRVYTSTGRVIDPEAGEIVAHFPGIPDAVGPSGFVSGAVWVRPDAGVGRVFFLLPPNSSLLKLVAYDQRTYQPAGSLDIPGYLGAPDDLNRWGSDGLAFLTSGGQNQLVLVRTSLVPPADLRVSFTPDTVGGSHPAVGSVTLPAPAPADGATVTLRSSSAAADVPAAVTVPPGAATAAFSV